MAPERTFVVNGSVEAIASNSHTAYLAGNFSYIGQRSGPWLAVSRDTGIHDKAFPELSGGQVGGMVSDGAGGWFIAGSFSRAGTVAVRGMAHVLADHTVDAAFKPEPDGPVTGMAASATTLYIIGTFQNVSGLKRTGLAAIDRVTGAVTPWRPILSNDWDFACELSLNAIIVAGDSVFVGGCFQIANALARRNFVAFDARSGNLRSTVLDSDQPVSALATDGQRVFVGGNFSALAGAVRAGFAVLDAQTLTVTEADPDVVGGVPRGVTSISVDQGRVAVAGYFRSWRGAAAHDLVVVDALTLDPVATTPTLNNPSAVTLAGNTLYVGDSQPVDGPFQALARLRAYVLGSTLPLWSTYVGQYGNSYPLIRTLAAEGPFLFVSGNVVSINGQRRYGVAAIDLATRRATAWAPRVGGVVHSIAADERTVYLGGSSSYYPLSVAGVARGGLAALDAESGALLPWHPVLGDSENVYTLLLQGHTLYLGGAFATLNGASRNGIGAIDTDTGAVAAWYPGPLPGTRRLVAAGSTLFASGFAGVAGAASNAGLVAVDLPTGTFKPWLVGVGAQSEGVFGTSVYDHTLYVSGTFSSLAGAAAQRLGALDTNTGAAVAWRPDLTAAEANYYPSLAATSGGVVIARNFGEGNDQRSLFAVDRTTGARLAWNSDLAPNGSVQDLESTPTKVLLGGYFSAIGGRSQAGYAEFDLP